MVTKEFNVYSIEKQYEHMLALGSKCQCCSLEDENHLENFTLHNINPKHVSILDITENTIMVCDNCLDEIKNFLAVFYLDDNANCHLMLLSYMAFFTKHKSFTPTAEIKSKEELKDAFWNEINNMRVYFKAVFHAVYLKFILQGYVDDMIIDDSFNYRYTTYQSYLSSLKINVNGNTGSFNRLKKISAEIKGVMRENNQAERAEVLV